MPLIEKVLGCSDYNEALAQFPYLGTPKADGVRGFTRDGCVLSKSNKAIPNRRIQHWVPSILGDGFDFELAVPAGFSATTSVVMADDAPIDSLEVCIFDYLSPEPGKIAPYIERCAYLHRLAPALPQRFKCLLPVVIRDSNQLAYFFKQCTDRGYEGCVLRKPEGTYKFGKSTEIEQLMMRLTSETTSEARIIGFEEQMTNDNESIVRENGRSKKSTAMSGLRPSGLLGSFTVRDINTEVVFSVTASNGLNWEDRRQIWEERDTYMNRLIKYSYKAHGTVDKPRQPKFLGFRSELDT